MSNLSVIVALGALAAMILAHAGQALQSSDFIEGFPDVPMLDNVRGMEGEPVFFDTLSGTVAEVTLLIEGGGDKAMEAYDTALGALGWQCETGPQFLRCDREANRLVFFDPDPKVKNGRIILRLEPVG